MAMFLHDMDLHRCKSTEGVKALQEAKHEEIRKLRRETEERIAALERDSKRLTKVLDAEELIVRMDLPRFVNMNLKETDGRISLLPSVAPKYRDLSFEDEADTIRAIQRALTYRLSILELCKASR